jgi:ADP-ribose pyrophosphatase YjhB (NUDIX family)
MKNILGLLDEVRSIAQRGLHFTRDEYDIERYTKLLQLCIDQYSNITNLEPQTIKERFNKEIGYITPKVGVNGIVFLNDDRVLLEKRSDDGLWGLPGGWAENGERPEDTLKREIFEETGMNVEVKEIINVFSRLPGDFGQPHTSYHLLYRCEVIDGNLARSNESLEIGFYTVSSIKNWHRDHDLMIKMAFRRYFES